MAIAGLPIKPAYFIERYAPINSYGCGVEREQVGDPLRFKYVGVKFELNGE